jgi:hypothetical protein
MNDSSDKKADDRAADPTIVGGRPLRTNRSMSGIPRGIDVLVKKASVDPDFRKILLDKRAEAAAEIGLELTPAEVTLLTTIPQSQIEQIIANTTVPDEHRRVFLGKIAALMLALVSVGLPGCGPPGINPFRPTLQGVEPGRPPAPQGIRPDDPRPPEARPGAGESSDKRPDKETDEERDKSKDRGAK